LKKVCVGEKSSGGGKSHRGWLKKAGVQKPEQEKQENEDEVGGEDVGRFVRHFPADLCVRELLRGQILDSH